MAETQDISVTPSPTLIHRPFDSLADVLASVGNVPPHRVRIHPPPGEATEDDVARIRNTERRLFELIDGTLVEKTMGAYESYLAVLISGFLGNYVRAHDLGVVLGADGMLRLAPRLVRIPDVSFLAWDQFPGRKFPRRAAWPLFPNLAIEVLSENNTRAEMQRKLHDYFTAGTSLVWYLDHETEVMEVYTSPTEMTKVSIDETLTGGEVLPGFTLPLGELFKVRPE